MWNNESLKVYFASILGFAAPGSAWLLDFGEPLMRFLVHLGQFGVAVATIFYISFKCRELVRKGKKRTPKK